MIGGGIPNPVRQVASFWFVTERITVKFAWRILPHPNPTEASSVQVPRREGVLKGLLKKTFSVLVRVHTNH